jgi:hypothetical protein
MMNDLEKYLYEKLDALQTEKAERLKNTIPNWLTKREAFEAFDKDIKAVLNKMFHEKRIKVHKTKDAPIMDYVEYIKTEENGR